jgi:hypothetical protein
MCTPRTVYIPSLLINSIYNMNLFVICYIGISSNHEYILFASVIPALSATSDLNEGKPVCSLAVRELVLGCASWRRAARRRHDFALQVEENVEQSEGVLAFHDGTALSISAAGALRRRSCTAPG